MIYVNLRTAFLLSATVVAPAALVAQTTMPTIAQPPAAAAPAAPEDPNKVVITIGSAKITVGQWENIVAALPAQFQSYARTAGKRAFAENLVQLNLLAGEAPKAGLDKTQKMLEQLKFQRENMLAQAMFEEIQKNAKVDDKTVQEYYDKHKNEYESVVAKHILIRVKGAPMPAPEGRPELTKEQALAKAQEIKKQLSAGGDFAAIAKKESDDTGSAEKGGDLGEFRRGMMVPPFETAAFAQKVGEVGEPVESPFGYHIIQVTEHKAKPISEVRGDVEKAMRPELAKKLVDDLRAKATVTIDDAFFGPAPDKQPPVIGQPVPRPQ